MKNYRVTSPIITIIKMKKHIAKLAVLIFLSLPTMACAQADAKNANITGEVSVLSPKGVISLEYPNQWDINKLIALSDDGSRLIDASENARYIRVWDWKNNKVVQRLLMNEKSPDMNDGKPHWDMVLQSSRGQELALSPDGRMVAACVNIERAKAASSQNIVTRVWNPESGEIVADNLESPLRHVPSLDQNAILLLSCKSLSFSRDGSHMAVLVDALQYSNELDFNEREVNYNAKTGRYKEGKHPVGLSGIALFKTYDWKLERFFYRPSLKQIFNSRPLFDPNSKTLSVVVFDRAPPNPNKLAWDEWAGNRIVRWNIASGAQLEEKDMPQLVESPSVGVWWSPLLNGHEVWWRTNYTAYPLVQTEAESEECRLVPITVPAFISEMASNCAYNWMLAVLNLDTGKVSYLAPVKKKVLPQLKDELKQHYSAAISPDGAHIVLTHIKFNPKSRLGTSTVEILDKRTLQSEGTYSFDKGILSDASFSMGSRYFAFKMDKSVIIFELPKKK